MKPDLARAVALLKREALFEGLDAAQLARIVNYFDMIEVEARTLIITEGVRADYFYIILSGHVEVTRRRRGREHLLYIMGPGDYFGEQALLLDQPHSESLTAAENTVLLRLNLERFLLLLNEYPDIRLNLSATAESRQLVRNQTFNWLGENEIIYLATRKHHFFLFIRLLFPIFLLSISLLGIGIAVIVEGLNIFVHPAGLFGALGLFAASAMIIWVWADWGNDFYIVTGKRVLWKEKIIALYESRREAPLNTVMAVNVSTTQIGRILGYGSVEVRTFTGGIHMRNMPNPELFAKFVKGYKKRSRAITKDKQLEEIEQAIEEGIIKRARQERGEIEIATEPPLRKKERLQREKRQSVQDRWQNFFKVRYEEETDKGVVITYRRHWYILFKEIWLPLLLLLIPFIALLMYFNNALPGTFLAIALMFGVFLFGWLWYKTEDWRNDIYRLTPDMILDMDKKPLGAEKKTTAPLDAPDFRVEHERTNIIGILLDFGNVTINVGQTELTFDGVYHPDQVHQDVSNYREENQRKKRAEQEKREREHMIDWLVAYYHSADQIDPQEILEKTGLGEGYDFG